MCPVAGGRRPCPIRLQDGAGRRRFEMIKTFSLSALFFMTLGVLAVTHAGLPF